MLDMMPENQSGYGSSALFEFSNLDAALEAAGPDLAAALADPKKRSKLSYARSCWRASATSSRRHIAVAAGLSPGFNSLDGD